MDRLKVWSWGRINVGLVVWSWVGVGLIMWSLGRIDRGWDVGTL